MTPLLDRDRLIALLEAARGLRVAIVGDAMLDVYLHGDVDRISPEAPVPVVRVRERRMALGGAANVAQNVAALGGRAALVATVGRDGAGEQLNAMLRALGTDPGTLVTIARPTTTKTRVLAPVQQVVRFDEEDDQNLSDEECAAVLQSLERAIAASDALVLEDYNKGLLVPAIIERAVELARARGIPIVVDPKFNNFFSYAGATIFKPNRRELEAALGASVNLDATGTLPGVVARLRVEHLLLTLGERGMVLIPRQGEMLRIPTTAREVFDVVGAGDTVTAYLATMLAAGASVTEAAVVANYAAGVEVGKVGAATVTADEVLAAWDASV